MLHDNVAAWSAGARYFIVGRALYKQIGTDENVKQQLLKGKIVAQLHPIPAHCSQSGRGSYFILFKKVITLFNDFYFYIFVTNGAQRSHPGSHDVILCISTARIIDLTMSGIAVF